MEIIVIRVEDYGLKVYVRNYIKDFIKNILIIFNDEKYISNYEWS